MEARQAACGRLAETHMAQQQGQSPSQPCTQPDVSPAQRHSAAVARRYASVLVYQLLHSGAGGHVGLQFLQHAAVLVDQGDVADQLFVVQVGHLISAIHIGPLCHDAPSV